MKKTAIATAVALTLGVASNVTLAAPTGTMSSATFSMYSAAGTLMTSPDTTVTGSIGGGTWSVASTTTFFGGLWTAHSGTTFGPGTYTFDTSGTGGGPSYTNIVVGANQIGGHILFNWGANSDIDVVQVWDFCNGCRGYTSTDIDGNGIRGIGMIDGAFLNAHANFDFKVAPIPVPAAVWLFGSSLLGLVGVARRKKAA